MNSHRSTFAKVVISILAATLCFAFAAAPSGAANHFLETSVPILPEPKLEQNGGDFGFDQADNGDAVAVWGQSDGVWASIRPAAGKFGAPFLLAANGSSTANPVVALGKDGHAVAVWRSTVMGIQQVFSATRQAGSAAFSAPIQVSEETFSIPSVKPDVDVVDNTNEAVIVWRGLDIDGNDNSSRIRRRFLDSAGNTNSEVGNISPVSAVGVDLPLIAVGPAGHTLASWLIGDVATGDPATMWTGPGGVTPDVEVFNNDSGGLIRGVVDSTGVAVITYKVGNDVLGNRRPTGVAQNFIFDQGLRLPATQGFAPFITMDAAGRTSVAFPYFTGGKWGIQTVERPAGPDTFFGTAVKTVSQRDNIFDLRIGSGAGASAIGWYEDAGEMKGMVKVAGAEAYGPESASLSPSTGKIGGEPAVTMDESGKALYAYSNRAMPGDDWTISARPYDDVPVAADLSIPTTVIQGQETQFSVNPVDGWADVTSVVWDVDNGVSKPGNSVTHTYMSPGQQMVVVNLTDALGNKTTAGQLIDVQPDTIAPVVKNFKIQKKKFKRGKKNAFRFNVNDIVKVTIKVKRTSKGKGKKAQGQIVKANLQPGNRKIGFRGKVGKRKLKPAKYQATIVAIDQFGNRSKKRNLSFRIIR